MRLFFLVIINVFIIACATTAPQKSHFTPAVAKSLLIKGQTTQADVLKVWGSPNITTRNSEGLTVWTYSKQSYDTKNSSGFASLFLVGGAQAVSKGASASFDVMITFDSNDVVQDFSITSSQF